METLAMFKPACGEESIAVHMFLWKSPASLRLKKARQINSKVRSMFFIFFDIKGIVHKEFDMADKTAYSTFT
jgi:hypothetical protein